MRIERVLTYQHHKSNKPELICKVFISSPVVSPRRNGSNHHFLQDNPKLTHILLNRNESCTSYSPKVVLLDCSNMVHTLSGLFMFE